VFIAKHLTVIVSIRDVVRVKVLTGTFCLLFDADHAGVIVNILVDLRWCPMWLVECVNDQDIHKNRYSGMCTRMINTDE
jgi:hypothetical protein